MQRILILLIVAFSCLFSHSFLFSQEEKELTKMERFVSNTGHIIKLENFKLSDLVAYNEKLQVKVSRATIGGKKAYFLLLIKYGKYSDKKAAIAEEDLKEILKAFENLIKQSSKESSSADYIENKFTTDDGFQIGYAKGKSITWFITLSRYSESTILFATPDQIKTTLSSSIAKIKELKLGD